jgi:NADH dehydrogenase
VRIAVAGGTGFVGRHISKSLVGSGHDVSVLTRDPRKLDRIPSVRGLHAIQADVTQPSSLMAKLEGFDAAVCAVQLPNYPVEQPRKGLTFDRYDRKGAENLLREAIDSGVRRFLYISGAGADVTSDKSWYRAKGYAEDSIRRSGIEHVILRPSWAYGPEDRALNRFAQIARFSPVIPKLGLRPQHIQPVYVEDIAGAVVAAFERDQAWNSTLEIGGPDVLTMDDVIRTMLDVISRRRLIVPIPVSLAKLGTAPLVLLPKPPMTPNVIEFAIQDGLVDTSEMEKVLDVHPIGLRQGLARYLG